ncbi:(-)-alpha-terpineol synthase, partial [Linum grandiflorum]
NFSAVAYKSSSSCANILYHHLTPISKGKKSSMAFLDRTHHVFNSSRLTSFLTNPNNNSQRYTSYPISLLRLVNRHTTPVMTVAFDVEGSERQDGGRRSGNYEPGMWGVVASSRDRRYLDGIYTGHISTAQYSNRGCGPVVMRRIEELKKYVKGRLVEGQVGDADVVITRLELIDVVQRLGLSYHFDKEIHNALQEIAAHETSSDCLYACALRFRLLRQARLFVSQDIFEKFRGDNGEFKPRLATDIKGLLALYEASHVWVMGEDIMEDAKAFAFRHLGSSPIAKPEQSTYHDLEFCDRSTLLSKQVEHALQLPLNWRMQRAETNWFVELYQKMGRHDDIIDRHLLELAELDFNLVQQVHRNELEELTSWWKDLGLKEEMKFARDPLVESFLWAIGMTSHPEMGDCRIVMSKVAILVHIIDDVYDVYGFLDELELFTAAIERWDTSELDKLPRYMQLCFMALYNTANQMSNRFDLNQREGFNSLPYIQKAWSDLCRSYLEEARSYRSERDQTLEQYLNVAWKSVACDVVLIHGYLSSGRAETLSREALDRLTQSDPSLTRLTSIIVRLTNDLASSKGELERGDVVKAVECYMKEEGVSEGVARGYINRLIDETWKMINCDVLFSQRVCNGIGFRLPPIYVDLAVNVARTSHYMYRHGVSRGCSAPKDKDRAVSLLFDSV